MLPKNAVNPGLSATKPAAILPTRRPLSTGGSNARQSALVVTAAVTQHSHVPTIAAARAEPVQAPSHDTISPGTNRRAFWLNRSPCVMCHRGSPWANQALWATSVHSHSRGAPLAVTAARLPARQIHV